MTKVEHEHVQDPGERAEPNGDHDYGVSWAKNIVMETREETGGDMNAPISREESDFIEKMGQLHEREGVWYRGIP